MFTMACRITSTYLDYNRIFLKSIFEKYEALSMGLMLVQQHVIGPS
jgi:hypothetical protein